MHDGGGTATSRHRGAATDGDCHAAAGSALAPASGALFGLSIDWSKDTLAGFAERLGHAPAVALTFAQMPLRTQDVVNVDPPRRSPRPSAAGCCSASSRTAVWRR